MCKLAAFLAMSLLAVSSLGAAAKGKGLQLKDLPAAVQKTVQENLRGGELKSISKEREAGVEQYEVESLLGGTARDFNVDLKGNLLAVEAATTIDAIPAAARAAILKKVADGKLGGVETVTKTGHGGVFEASYTDKKGKRHEVLVSREGVEAKP